MKETTYKTLVRPKLQYACSAWDPHHQKDKAALERIQRKAARFVTGNYDRTTSVTEMLQDLQWDTLEMMRRHARLSTVSLRSKRFRGAKSEEETGLSAFGPREKWGKSKNKEEGVGEGKEGTACTQAL